MRICYLSGNQDFVNQPFQGSRDTYYHEFFLLLGPQTLTPSPKTVRTLKSRHITPEADTLPFQATSKLYHSTPSKRFRTRA